MTKVELYPPALQLLRQDFYIHKSKLPKHLYTIHVHMYKNNTIGTHKVFFKSSKIHIFQILEFACKIKVRKINGTRVGFLILILF